MLSDELRLVQTDDGLGQRVVVGVSARTDRADRAGIVQPLRVANSEVLDATVGVMNQTLEVGRAS